jgi:hypothetical protein
LVIQKRKHSFTLREVEARVVSVTKDCNCPLCNKSQKNKSYWHIILKPTKEGFKNFHVWLTADAVYEDDPTAVSEDSQLGIFITRLESLGLAKAAKTVDEALAEMNGKLFIWERAKLGTSSKEKWVPKQLITEAKKCLKCEAEVKDGMKFCPNCGARL